jgi:hypothetical protein
MSAPRGTAAVVVAVVVVACSGGGGGSGGGKDTLLVDAPGIETEIALVAPPEEGAGKIPTFEWRRVKGASGYRLAVPDAGGDALWAWQGTATSVVLGGVADRPVKGEAGPVLEPWASWSVLAFDRDGSVVAVSSLRAVSP